jgi:hypothetical protein
MTRKNRRPPPPDDDLDLDVIGGEVRERVDKWISHEEQHEQEWLRTKGLTDKERIAFHNERIPNGRRRRREMRHVTTCQLPKCDRETIRLMGRPLGICYEHGYDVIIYFDTMSDLSPFRDAERVRRAANALSRLESEELLEARAAERRRISPGWIYYLLIGDHIKIGYTKDVKRRLRAYPPGSRLLALHAGTKQLERETHAQFAGSRSAGREWFLDTPELREHVKVVIEQFGEPDRARYEHHGTGRNKSRLKA